MKPKLPSMYCIHRKEENISKYIYIDKMNFNVLHNIEIKGKNSNPNALGFHASLNSAARRERAYSFLNEITISEAAKCTTILRW